MFWTFVKIALVRQFNQIFKTHALLGNKNKTRHFLHTLRKHAYSNTLKILPPKNGSFSEKKF